MMGVSVPLPHTFGSQGGDRGVRFLVHGERRGVKLDWLLSKAWRALVLQ